jgi:hypothetical protein
MHALDLGLSPVTSAGTFAFRVGDEEASLVDGEAVPGLAEDADVLVETDAIGFYHLVVNRQLEGARIEGDPELLEGVLAAFAPTPQPTPA